MTMLDADALLESIEAPTVQINGRMYRGRILSLQQFLPFASKAQEVIKDGNVDPAAFISFAKEYLTAIFPKNKIIVWQPNPVEQLLDHPKLVEILLGFLELQQAAVGMVQPKKNLTSGTN